MGCRCPRYVSSAVSPRDEMWARTRCHERGIPTDLESVWAETCQWVPHLHRMLFGSDITNLPLASTQHMPPQPPRRALDSRAVPLRMGSRFKIRSRLVSIGDESIPNSHHHKEHGHQSLPESDSSQPTTSPCSSRALAAKLPLGELSTTRVACLHDATQQRQQCQRHQRDLQYPPSTAPYHPLVCSAETQCCEPRVIAPQAMIMLAGIADGRCVTGSTVWVLCLRLPRSHPPLATHRAGQAAMLPARIAAARAASTAASRGH